MLSLALSVGAAGLWLGPHLVYFNAAIQHLGSSRPPSVLRDGWFSRMWIATFTSSSSSVLAQSQSVTDIMTSVHTSFILALEKVRVPWPKRWQGQICFSHAGIREAPPFLIAVPAEKPSLHSLLVLALTKTTTAKRMLLFCCYPWCSYEPLPDQSM